MVGQLWLRAVTSLCVTAVIGLSVLAGPAAAQSTRQKLALKPDSITQNAGTTTNIDVLANDTLGSGSDGQTIEIISQPACGTVTAQTGWVSYQSIPECDGPQIFYYGIAGFPAFAEVTVLVRPAEPGPELSAAMIVIDTEATPHSETAGTAEQAIAGQDAGAATFAGTGSQLAETAITAAPTVPPRLEPVAPAELAPLTAPEAAPETSAGPTPVAADEIVAAANAGDVSLNGSCADRVSATASSGPAALTDLTVSAPCTPGSVAELDYGGLRLGVAIDSNGMGKIVVPGFAAMMPATLSFADGSKHQFDLAFSGFDEVERLAVAWDAPVMLTLNALEFGAEPGSAGHIGPANPRSYADVSKAGGGFQTTYKPVNGVGASVQVYTHLAKNSGGSGIVQLLLDFTSRKLGDPNTCGDAPLAQPDILVMKSDRGLPAPTAVHTPKVLDCSEAVLDSNRLGDPVGNVVVR